MTFKELAKIQEESLKKQGQVSLEQAKEQVERIKARRNSKERKKVAHR